MTDQELYKALERATRRAGIRVLRGRPRIRGGSCFYRGREFVVLHRDSDLRQHLQVLAHTLAECDLDDAFFESEEARAVVAEARRRLQPATRGEAAGVVSSEFTETD
jgi:hypothetical protein